MRAESLDEMYQTEKTGGFSERRPSVQLELSHELIRGKPGQIIQITWSAQHFDNVIVRRVQFDEERSSTWAQGAIELALDYFNEWLQVTAVGSTGLVTRRCRLEVEIDSLCDVTTDLETIELGEIK